MLKNNDIDYLLSTKRFKPKIIASYEAILRLFTRYLEDNFNSANVKDVTDKICKDYVTYTKERRKYTFVTDKNTTYINHPLNRMDYGRKGSISIINTLRETYAKIYGTYLF